MRIAIWHNLPSGGGKRALYYHVRGLRERGHTVEAWCPPTADQSYLPLGELIPEHVVPLAWRPDEARSLSARVKGPAGEARRMHAALEAHARACAAEMAAGQFEVLLANPCRYLFTPSIGRFSTLPSLLYLQEPNRVLYEALPVLPWIAQPRQPQSVLHPKRLVRTLRSARELGRVRLMGRLELENARAFDRILVNSYFSRESVLRAYGLDARVCYLGVDTDLFTAQRAPREDIVVGIGSIAPTKNVAFLVEAVGCLSEPRPRLVWIGNVSEPGYAEAVTQLAASRRVPLELKLRVSDDELVELLNRARVIAYAPRLEPFGFAPLEANACALPVVAVAEGGVRETVIDGVNGLLVESDHQAMADAIQRLRRDTAYATELGESGRRLAQERWSLAASIARLERHLHEVSSAHAPLKKANAPASAR